jgi:hypothetical protein
MEYSSLSTCSHVATIYCSIWVTHLLFSASPPPTHFFRNTIYWAAAWDCRLGILAEDWHEIQGGSQAPGSRGFSDTQTVKTSSSSSFLPSRTWEKNNHAVGMSTGHANSFETVNNNVLSRFTWHRNPWRCKCLQTKIWIERFWLFLNNEICPG